MKGQGNNTFVNGQVKVGVQGDVNNDNKVDMTDVGIVLRNFGKSRITTLYLNGYFKVKINIL